MTQITSMTGPVSSLRAQLRAQAEAALGTETYKTPFNLEEMPPSFTTFDLSFVRRKHLGF